MAARVVLLGPQRHDPTLRETVDSLGVEGRIAAVTAGWEEREHEDQELSDHLGGRVVNLSIYQRVEDVYRRDPQLFRAVRERHDALRGLQELYRLRLAHGLEAARQLLLREGESEPLLEARQSAIEAVRTLDAQHLRQVRRIHAAFEAEHRPLERPHVARHQAELADILDGCSALCVAGGHVAILLNRMRQFDLPALVGERTVFAWSAGAMALSERIVLFHDSPPQGPGDAEVLEAGLGLYRGVVPLPHATKRLQLADELRVALFARRFAPDRCVALDPFKRLDWDGSAWSSTEGTLRLTEEGGLLPAA